jgi:glutamine synthetase
MYVEPELRSIKLAAGSPYPSATVMSCLTSKDGELITQCTRCTLKDLVTSIQSDHFLNLCVGFEIECVFLRRRPENQRDPYAPLTKVHAWGTLSGDQWINLLPLAMEIEDALEKIGISIEAMHPESAPGQYEFVLPPLPPLDAIDTLYQARQCITMIAEQHNLRATLHPKPYPGAGSGAHMHVSLNSNALSATEIQVAGSHFWAEVLAHAEALCAFTLPEAESYSRVAENSWTGGAWIAWGTQNREVPIRKSADNRWEIRIMDGLANVYTALAVILALGLQGLKTKTPEILTDCPGEY